MLSRCKWLFAITLIFAGGVAQGQSSQGEDSEAGDAEPDPVELRAARFLFTEGNHLTDRREHERALEALTLSHELYRAANTAVNIVGLLIDTRDYSSARVWLEYARTLPDLNARAQDILSDFERVIEKHQGTLRLVIDDASNFEITIEDRPVPGDELLRGISLDPGRYYLEVQQQGMVTFGTNVAVRAGRETEVRYEEHTIRRRKPTTATTLRFAPPKEPAPSAEETSATVAPPPPSAPAKSTRPIYDEPWFRGLVATAVSMTILSTALIIDDLQ